MKPAVLFLVKFVCLTAPLIWLWQVGGLSVYHAIYSPIASASTPNNPKKKKG